MGYRRRIVVVRAVHGSGAQGGVGLQGQGSLFDGVPEGEGVPPQPLRTGVRHLSRMADPDAHGVRPILRATDERFGARRRNPTFRRAV